MPREINVAIVQAFGSIFDLEEGMSRLEYFVEMASSKNVDFVLFPEAFLGGYPRGLSFGTVVGERSEEGRELWRKYSESCPLENGQELERIRSIAAQFKISLAVGVVERSILGGSLYCSIWYFSSAGKYLGGHRKLKPTAAERVIWSDSKIEDSLTVVNFDWAKVGGLICWENYMPLARMALFQQGVELYVAPTADQRQRWPNSMIHIALEGRCFVLSANQYVHADSISDEIKNTVSGMKEFNSNCRGGSMIVDPSGEILVGPVWDREELIVQTIDLGEVQKAKMDFDVIGHYARSEAFHFDWAKKKAD